MTCPTCQALIADDSHFCSSCGAPTGGAAVALADADDTRSLAQANLLRMRAQWRDAEARCIDVMRADPNNVHAHSLLGDIYRDQGRLDEACQWYRMALDLAPDSAADRTKLEGVERERARLMALDPGSPAGNGAGVAVGTQKLMGLSPVLWVRGLTALTVVFLVVVVALLMLMRQEGRPGSGGPSNGPSAVLPNTAPPPISLEPPASGAPAGPTLPAPSLRNPSPSTSPLPSRDAAAAPGKTPAGVALSQRESALLAAVSRQAQLNTGTAVGSITVDPRIQRATLVLVHRPAPQNLMDGVPRELVLGDALRAASVVFQTDSQVLRATVSVRVVDAGGRAESFFEGDIERGANTFSNAWWAAPSVPSPSDLDYWSDTSGNE